MIIINNLIDKAYYQTDKGILLQGDTIENMKLLEDKSIDCIIADLPYGTTASTWDKIIPSELLWEQYERIIKDNGVICLFSSGLYTMKLMNSNEKLYKYKWVWIKNKKSNFVHAKNRPMTQHEDILVFSKAPMGHVSQLGDKRMTYNPQGLTEIDEVMKYGHNNFQNLAGTRKSHVKEVKLTHTGYPTDVLFYDVVSQNKKLHSNQKPVELLEFLIQSYSDEGEIVLDNTSGSGSLAVACENTNRRWICIEKEKEYCDITIDRLSKLHK